MCLNCHVISMDVQIKDIDALVSACIKLGYTFQPNKPHRWFGLWVGDSPIPRQLFNSDADYNVMIALPPKLQKEQMAKLIDSSVHSISVPGHKYSIGLVPCGDHFALAHDNWVAGGGDINMQPLVNEYTRQAAINEAIAQCQTYTETTLEDGTIQLRIQVGA